MSLSGSLSVSSMVIVQDFALLGLGGQTGRRAQQELINNCGFHMRFFLSSIGKKSKLVSYFTDHLCYLHIYFQQIETELRHMELIKDQYQKKNYEQVDDFHKLCLPFT